MFFYVEGYCHQCYCKLIITICTLYQDEASHSDSTIHLLHVQLVIITNILQHLPLIGPVDPAINFED
jgi:hypothetical protein